MRRPTYDVLIGVDDPFLSKIYTREPSHLYSVFTASVFDNLVELPAAFLALVCLLLANKVSNQVISLVFFFLSLDILKRKTYS